ncbi:MAG: hypothetical protein WC099_01790 [Candidatus Paceibacterota bacterium]
MMIIYGILLLSKKGNTDEVVKKYITSVYTHILGFNLGLEPSSRILDLVRKKRRELGIRSLCIGIFGLMVLSLLVGMA